ncbi:MAG: hypothetical protein KF781_00365 [Chitinophagaceae bacterium]|nr:hypothetical protein [Chitinophagaceae bacterium]MCW5905187.1 hypothetical protein [Chitinophagaceae bacterium]
MKFFTAIILTALLTYAIGLFTNLPWYSFVFCALIIAIAVHQKPWKAFLSAFIAVFILWIVLAAIIDNANEHLLSKKVAEILPLNGNYTLLIIVTGFIGGLAAGMSALTGSFLRKIK